MSSAMDNGETDIQQLLQSMSPVVNDTAFVFLTFEGAVYGEHSNLEPIASFIESEGLTLVVPKQNADKQALSYRGVFKCITLQIHSSLEAVGLTAAFAAKLTNCDISANVIAGFYHDHIFVSELDAERAALALNDLARNGH